MEGPRLPPSATAPDSDDDKPDDHPSVWHRPTSSLPDLSSQDNSPTHHWRNHSLNLSPIQGIPTSPLPHPDSIPELETYVIQVPRDQVYWTPPPEHAIYVEKRLKNPEKNKNNGCSKKLMWFFIILIVFGLVLGAITLILHFVFNPALPVFAIEKFSTIPSNDFEVMFKAKNPTSNMGVTYMMKKAGVVSLTYKNKSLGRGKLPKTSQTASGSGKVNVKFEGSTKNADLPPRGSKQPVSLVLKMELEAEYEAGLIKKNKELVVTCDVKVKGLLDAKKVEMVSENCESEFKN